MTFKYSLTYDEAFEAFHRLAARGNPVARKIVAIGLLGLSAALIVMYALEPTRLEYFFLPILCLATYFGMMYYPGFKARRGAKAVATARGHYQVEITESGLIRSGGEDIELDGDKDARAFETSQLFVIRPDRLHTFCLPKRIMKEAEALEVREILKSRLKKFKIDSDPA
ncbi:hypothetical protein C4J81_11495 [Deltaproteobacteria bacterium Smac51]|nr:hypothetical protein C4J81_11495 [Deltaproteobacteria bacterium Smac51]